MTAPTVVVGGAQKAGTTSLFYLLSSHPSVFGSPVKEPQHFAFTSPAEFAGPGGDRFTTNLVLDEARYRALFERSDGAQHRLEASTLYLSEPQTPGRLAQANPDVRLIFVLRDPVDRAYSAFCHLRREGIEPLDDFLGALHAEEDRARAGWIPMFGYARLSRYAEHLALWCRTLPRHQLLVVGYEHLERRPLELLRRVETFLDLPAHDGYDVGTRHNVTGAPRSATIHRALSRWGSPSLRRRLRRALPAVAHRAVVRLRGANLRPMEPLLPATRAEAARLIGDQRPDIATRFGDEVVDGWR